MTSIIKLEVLSGAMDESPLCYLLQVDEFHFLLDCGWDENFSMSYIETIKKKAHMIDAILITFADPLHLGALPYLVGKCGINCPVYATVPVYKMGQMFMYDWFQSHLNMEDFNLFNLDDVDAAFDKFQQLKYSQNVGLKGKGHGLQITPFPAGHMIGGTIWRITKMGEDEIVYAVDFNHKKERHLNGCTFEQIGRPNLLITDSFNARYQQARRKQRDEQLLTNILQTVRGGGNVLVVIDTAGRVLEIAQLLDQLWHNAEAGLITYSLVLMNNVAFNVVEFAKSQVEWMSDKVLKSFEEGRHNPFQFRHVQIIHSMNELRKVRSPMVVLASAGDMESGFSRELFLEWYNNPKHSIIMTSRAGPGTLSRKLIESITTGNRHQTVMIKRRVRLDGPKLEEFYLQKKKQEQEAARLRLESQRRQSRIDHDESSDSSEDEAMDQRLEHNPYDIMLRFDHHQKSSFFKQVRKQHAMFPFNEEKIKWDDYGEIIRTDDYKLAEGSTPVARGNLRDVEMDGVISEGDQPQEPAAVVDIPTECVSAVQKIEVQCKLAFIDFEGRCDGDSIRKLMSQIKPKQLILIHGTPDATQFLADHCSNPKQNIVAGQVFMPKIGETVDATIESHIYQVTLTDPLMNSVDFEPVKDAELGWLDARIMMRKNLIAPTEVASGTKTEPDGSLTAKPENGQDVSDMTPCLDMLPSVDIPSHQAVFVNDPKLSDLKQTLMLSGYQAEFSGGVLYVNQVISIRRTEAGKFHIDGTVCEQYFKVRDMLYKQFAVA